MDFRIIENLFFLYMHSFFFPLVYIIGYPLELE